MREMPARRAIAAAGLASLVLAACGGATPTEAPPTRSGSPVPQTAAPATPPPVATTAPTQAGAGPTTDPFAFAAQFEGAFSGTWLNQTFGSEGPARIQLALDRGAGAMTFTITLGGNVFGQPKPAPETLTATIVPGAGMTFQSATFGETTVTVDLTGPSPWIIVSSPDVPSARIKTFEATAMIEDPDTIEFRYTVTFRDGGQPAAGSALLDRE